MFYFNIKERVIDSLVVCCPEVHAEKLRSKGFVGCKVNTKIDQMYLGKLYFRY